MADVAGLGGGAATGSALDRQTEALLHRFGPGSSLRAGGSSGATSAATGKTPGKDGKIAEENRRIEKSAGDFEAILLGSWLQQAEKTFAEVPGGDGEDSAADPGKEQLQELSVQSLAGALTASGGIGLAKMISAQLKKSETQTIQPGKVEAGKIEQIEQGKIEQGKVGQAANVAGRGVPMGAGMPSAPPAH